MDRQAIHRDVLARSRDGQSGWRIAQETGIPVTTVYTWLKNPGKEVRHARDGDLRHIRTDAERLRDEVLRLFSTGLTGYQISKQTGIPDSTVYYWRDHPAKNPRNTAACFRCTPGSQTPDEPAYAYLLGQYLGDGHIVTNNKSVVLAIYCCDGWPGVMEETEQAMRRALPHVSVYRAQKKGCTGLSSGSRHWLCLLPQHGPGMKHQRTIKLEPWQQTIVDRHPGWFVRGLIHSDGCRSMNRIKRRDGDGYHEYPRYFFSNKSQDIHGLLADALDRLGIEWRFSRTDAISVAKRESVARMDEIVGPKY